MHSFKENYFHGRSRDLILLPVENFLWMNSGTNHGTPYKYDSHVPIVLKSPNLPTAKVNESFATKDLAPLIEKLIE